MTKIELLGSSGGIAATGKYAWGTPPSATDFFDLYAVTRAFIGGSPVGILNSAEYRQVLGDSFRRGLEAVPTSLRPPLSEVSTHIFQLFAFYLDATGALSMTMAIGKYVQESPIGVLLRMGPVDSAVFETASPLVGGVDEVWREIVSGSDPRFDDLRRDPIFQRLATRPGPASGLSDDDAIAFGTRLIGVTAERMHLLRGFTSVGAGYDVAILDRVSGARFHKTK